jgi:hypothetical protein
MAYALFISLGLYGAYVLAVAMSPRRSGKAPIIIALLVAILTYTALKVIFIRFGIQSQ